MNQSHEFSKGIAASEMAIVDTFTKLIFGQEGQYTDREALIIQALRLVDASVALDSYVEMGQYLRTMGVEEMIELVSRVQLELAGGVQLLSDVSKPSILDRRTH